MQNYQPEMEKAATAIARHLLNMKRVSHQMGQMARILGQNKPTITNVPQSVSRARQLGMQRSRSLSPEEWRIRRIENRLGRKVEPWEMGSVDPRRYTVPANTTTYKPVLMNNPQLDSMINNPVYRDVMHNMAKQDGISSVLYPYGRTRPDLWAARLP